MEAEDSPILAALITKRTNMLHDMYSINSSLSCLSRHLQRVPPKASTSHDIMHPHTQIIRVLRRLDSSAQLWRARHLFRSTKTTPKTWQWRCKSTWRCRCVRTFRRMCNDLRWKAGDSDSFGFVIVRSRDDLGCVRMCLSESQGQQTSMISSRGKESNGMSAALQAMR